MAQHLADDRRLQIHALSEAPGTIPEGSWVIPKDSNYTWMLSWDGALNSLEKGS